MEKVAWRQVSFAFAGLRKEAVQAAWRKVADALAAEPGAGRRTEGEILIEIAIDCETGCFLDCEPGGDIEAGDGIGYGVELDAGTETVLWSTSGKGADDAELCFGFLLYLDQKLK